ncbi:conserved Plasmodium protein, unknown function [Plasmodium gallinaceum]|uniref:Metallo-beta-lactamase domain-containing protein n=1 Tax=Plasmodium gallinaceum TaxID=5849 RepID=A0A1J1GT67_PLAGA|nr:conserved Plasmodium protein, unknown function [Plasmodium gallinaceum]CRG95682.1 conserved Plasmodium protein, unknown function [Plasmodium gallinaceum]
MKKLINTFLPYYIHNNNLTTNLTFKKKISFFFFYVDRYIYSPLINSLLKNKNAQEKNIIKKVYTKKIFDILGLKNNYNKKKNENVENINDIYKKYTKYTKCSKEAIDKNSNNTNDINYKNFYNNEEMNAIWPDRIFYVTPLEVKKKIENEKFNVIYIGHMSILVQIKNFNILIDPVLSSRIGFFNILGVKRTIKAGISFENLPSIDFVLLSNNRFDIMDKNTLKKIILRDNSIVIGGMNIRRYLFKRNFPVVYPLNWFNKLTFENISFYYLPSLTNSHRYFIDKNIYLPGSFLIHNSTNNSSIFYSGHSGYSNHFLQIKSYVNTILKNDRIDLSILPIGIYKPSSLYNHFHMSPKQALQSHFDLNSKKSLGIGSDVFCLGGEEYNEATNELQNILNIYEKEKKKKIDFITLQPGQNIIL